MANQLTSGGIVAALRRHNELVSRILFLLGALLVYRIGSHIPVPGINSLRLQELFSQNENTLLSVFNTFSGGALERLSIMALGIMPYISAAIIIQMMTAVVPSLEAIMLAKINIEIPLPTPRSVICSPSHIKNMVPVASDITAGSMKLMPVVSVKPELCRPALMPIACRIARNKVPWRVYCEILR